MPTNKDKLDEFLVILNQSCKRIESEFFYLRQHDQDPVYRERVYSYELYHQLRIAIATNINLKHLSINGEVDKSGRRGFNKEKPDLILHLPESMEENIAVIEIKTANGTKYKKANNTLRDFTNIHKYEGGIFLTFGSILKDSYTQRLENQFHPKCFYFLHESPQSNLIEINPLANR